MRLVTEAYLLGPVLQSAGENGKAGSRRQSLLISIMSFRNYRPSIVALVLIALAISTSLLARPTRADQQKELTAEQIAEAVILIAGTRPGLAQIRKNGIERGRMSRMTPDGRPEEARYELRFIHGEKIEKDKIRVDQKTASTEYTLVNSEGRVFGIINGSLFTPRAETASEFLSQQIHSIDALLRYKENESKVTSAGKDKQQGIDLHVLDLVDKANHKTRYFVSAKSFRVLWLEYEDTPADQTTPVKFMKRFYDYRYAQGTLVPYRTVMLVDGKLVLETRILTVTYGVKMEDSLFQNPESASGQ